MARTYEALRRAGISFGQEDFSENSKRNPKNKPINKMLVTTASKKATGRLKLKRYNTTFSRLLKLVLNMSEREQLRLLEYAKSIIDERTLPRYPCLIPVNCTIKDRSYEGLILDINHHGAYVDTNEAIPIGQEIYLSFFNPFSDRQMDLSGKIIWSGTNGIGVSFTDLARALYIW